MALACRAKVVQHILNAAKCNAFYETFDMAEYELISQSRGRGSTHLGRGDAVKTTC